MNKTWMAQLSTVGVDGIPHCSKAGNVLRPYTTLTLSLRLPPIVDAEKAAEKFV